MSKIAAIVGRILIALIFIVSGVSKLANVGATETMIVGVGLPAGLAIPTGLFELLAGLCLAAGFMVRLVSALLVLFTAATILFFHRPYTDPLQQIMVLKNIAIIGGLFLAFAHSQMWYHYYAMTREWKGEKAALDAETRLHDAELRAARAEGRIDAMLENQPATPATQTNVTYDMPETRRRRFFDW